MSRENNVKIIQGEDMHLQANKSGLELIPPSQP